MIENREIENSVIGGCLINTDLLHLAMTKLTTGHFSDARCRIVFEGIEHYFEKGVSVDMVTMEGYLQQIGKLAALGSGYLIGLTTSASSYSNIEQHMALLQECKVARELWSEMKEVEKDLNASTAYASVDKLSAFVTSVGTFGDDDEQGLSALEILELEKDKPKSEKLLTGSGVIDNRISAESGFYRGQLVVSQAESSHGKTRAGVYIHSLFAKQGYKTAWFQLEDYRGKTAEMFKDVCGEHGKNIYIFDKIDDIERIKREARRMKRMHNIDLLAVDYVQNVECYQKVDQPKEYVSRQLTKLAQELDICVHVMSQVTIDQDKRRGWARQPRANDVRWTKQIKQDAHLIISWFRPGVVEECYVNGTLVDMDGTSPLHHLTVVGKQVKSRYGVADPTNHYFIDDDNHFKLVDRFIEEAKIKSNDWREPAVF